ncbi:hypothetical protein GGF31_008011 [Allomyces arbusculus]|nr:hypothetical protein GGF31_008011 [Allomyces arbusculus]
MATTNNNASAPVTRAAATEHLLYKTKPPGSLGALENWAEQLMVVQNTLSPKVDKARMLLFAADNGLAAGAEVSQYPRAVTREMLKNIAAGGAAINCLCRAHGIELKVLDLGVDTDQQHQDVEHFRLLAHGSANPLEAPAMDGVTFSYAQSLGRKAFQAAKNDGVQVLGLGELGIGNTAVASTLLGAATRRPATDVTGAGTGVTGPRYEAKCQAVTAVLAKWDALIPTDATALTGWSDVLRTIGDLEIVAMAAVIHEAAVHGGIVVVIDGFITMAALLYALLVWPDAVPAIVTVTLFSHLSAEAPAALMLETIAAAAVARGADKDVVAKWQQPIGRWELRLGEGSGAALVIPLLRSAAMIAADMATFQGAGVSTEKTE